ncbi:substrate-binding domain-containing protein [Gloeothece verrucosa]|uniref:Serine/threonine kinase n=1 Tax=Gloeothece verrucosa (strain PCC 7822) TaxID=497965 RepID=E0UAQ7_GLOV7|nr:substrate-binding domain-containing protein [Gloeothece verrucosa]ADN13909.1 serine/threonine kinase [Gloeothece verrucosa PCC 7822]
MKIADLYHRVRNGIRYIVSFGRFNPASQSGQHAIIEEMRRKAVEAAEHIDIPGSDSAKGNSSEVRPFQAQFPWSYQNEPSATHSSTETPIPNISAPIPIQEQRNDPFYPAYQCKTNDALGCYYPQQTLQQTPQAKFCLGCGFPVPLAENREIRGRRGIYQTGTLVGKRGIGRIYRGIQKNENQPIVIKEFLLPNRSFKNLEDFQQRQATFVRVANLTAADGRDKDFRLIIPWEAVADEQERRCYLITKSNLDTLPTLSSYLSSHGAMTNDQVKLLLDQILQSLEFLHGQRFQFSSGQIQTGLVHGNLNLNSVLISESNQQDFFVYLTDLLLWEYLFYRPDTQINPKTVNDDLMAVGEIGFKMLMGPTGLDPRNDQHWLGSGTSSPPKVEPALKQFILQLLGLNSSFATATNAREVLLKLPKPQTDEQQKLTPDEDLEAVKRRSWMPWIVAPAIVILGVITVGIVGRLSHKSYPVVNRKVLIPSIAEIEVPPGNFTYTLEKDGSASYVFLEPNLLSTQKSLIDELQQRKPGVILQAISANDGSQASQQVAQGMANFAIISQIAAASSSSVEQEAIAYDGLLIVVPFSYDQRERGLPKALGGKITFEQIRDLYSGKIENWKDIGGPDLPVKLYVPTQPSAIQLFEEKVLQDPAVIATFRDLLKQNKIQKKETLQTLRTLQYEFENEKIGGISFGFSSQIFGQCGGYPLALQVATESPIIAFLKRIFFLGDDAQQVWIQPNNHSIDPSTNLCKKGSYQLAEELFQTNQYPLAFPLVVLYPRDNRDEPAYQIGRKFAQVLTTEEGQTLLQETNLVPLQSLK